MTGWQHCCISISELFCWPPPVDEYTLVYSNHTAVSKNPLLSIVPQVSPPVEAACCTASCRLFSWVECGVVGPHCACVSCFFVASPLVPLCCAVLYLFFLFVPVCLVLSLSYLVLSYCVLSCLTLSGLILSCCLLSCFVLSYLSGLVCFVLSCLVCCLLSAVWCLVFLSPLRLPSSPAAVSFALGLVSSPYNTSFVFSFPP